MTTLNSKSRYRAIAAANKLVDKYGQDCTVIVSADYPTPIPASCLFTRNKLELANNNLILNNNFKILLKVVALPDLLSPTDSKIVVNGATLTAMKVHKLTPDGVNAILWEIEALGDVLPNEVAGISKPTIISPANNTSFFPATEGVGGWYIACQGNAPNTIGDVVFNGSEWQIATDEGFNSVVATGTVEGTYWVTPSVLQRNTTYYIRTRYNASVVGFSEWSDYSLFSLDEIGGGTVTRITKPSIVNTVDNQGAIDPDVPPFTVIGKHPYAPTNLANVTITASPYAPLSAGAFASITFHVANDSAFTDLVVELTQAEGYGYDVQTAKEWDVTQGYIPQNFVFVKGNTYYARVKYTSIDPYESEWSDTFTFIVNQD